MKMITLILTLLSQTLWGSSYLGCDTVAIEWASVQESPANANQLIASAQLEDIAFSETYGRGVFTVVFPQSSYVIEVFVFGEEEPVCEVDEGSSYKI